jgi:transcriptional regulator with XRE-family HTH domain
MLPAGNLFDLGQQFRRERKALGKTQAEVAQAAGLRRETILGIEAGRNADLLSFMRACAGLGRGVLIASMTPTLDDLERMFGDED